MVILIHGLGVDHRMWFFQQRRLGAKFQITAPDLPAFGGSAPLKNDRQDYLVALADWLAGEIERNGGGKADLAGYSMGGTIALLVALRRPDLVNSLTLACTSAKWSRGRGWMGFLTRWPFGGIGAYFVGLGMRINIRLLVKSRADRELLDSMMELADKKTVKKLMKELWEADLTGRLGEIDAPTLIIGGESDFLAPVAHLRELAAGIKGSKLETIKGAGHYLCVQKARELAEAMERFLEAAKRADA